MNSFYLRLISKLKDYRVSIFMTQDDIAEKANISKKTIVNIEKGLNVSVDNFVKYISALGLLQSFANFPPIVDMRFEDIPFGKYKRVRATKKKHNFVWGEDK